MSILTKPVKWVQRPIVGLIPRPVELFLGAVLLLVVLKWVLGPGGGQSPRQVARAVAEGMITVLKDDQNLRQGVLFFTKDGQNHDGTVEIRDLGAGLGGLLLGGGLNRVGGSVYFHGYRHSSGVTLTGGPLDLEFRAGSQENGGAKQAVFRMQGTLQVAEIDQPVTVQLEFVSEQDTYQIDALKGQITINQQTTTL
ncbi:hypothetical protein [Larkinella terrae]|uniref:Uncharacterized protein n=1 Tax=Larkinella terrae TaxID=2025311 RepID=A0A7K0EES7_9BACT|nr:hypothetical protein [Larkinella terrae]MRS60324.1 hypothetical protein [Larkinella terrae]